MHQWPQGQSKRRATSSSTNAAFSIHKPSLLPEKRAAKPVPKIVLRYNDGLCTNVYFQFSNKNFLRKWHLSNNAAFDPPVSKDSLVSASDFKMSQTSGCLNLKRLVRILSPDRPLPQDLSDFGRENKKSWAGIFQNSSHLLSNVDWTWTFWKSTNATNTMHTLGIKGADDAKRLAAFWIIGIIEYAHFELNPTYLS